MLKVEILLIILLLERNVSGLLLVNTNTRLVNKNYEWLALLKYRQNGSQFCLGSLIADKYVLTAAHCLNGKKPDDMIITFLNNSEQFTISQIFVHENFTTRWAYNDIGLIQLETSSSSSLSLPATFRAPLEIDYSYRSAEGRNLSVIVNNKKIMTPIQLKVLSSGDPLCSAYSNGLNYSSSLYCAYGTPNVCLGDSGSPLFGVDPRTKRNYLYGLVSVVLTFLDPSDHVIKCFPQAPAYFTRVSFFLQWLKQKMSGGGKRSTLTQGF